MPQFATCYCISRGMPQPCYCKSRNAAFHYYPAECRVIFIWPFLRGCCSYLPPLSFPIFLLKCSLRRKTEMVPSLKTTLKKTKRAGICVSSLYIYIAQWDSTKQIYYQTCYAHSTTTQNAIHVNFIENSLAANCQAIHVNFIDNSHVSFNDLLTTHTFAPRQHRTDSHSPLSCSVLPTSLHHCSEKSFPSLPCRIEMIGPAATHPLPALRRAASLPRGEAALDLETAAM